MNQNEFRQKLDRHDRVVVFFSAPGCTVCTALLPKVEALMEEYEEWTLLAVSSAESPAVAGQLLVFTAPTLVFFREGREVGRLARNFGIADVRRELEA